MSWRTVCISKRAKLEYRMGYMVIRSKDKKRINLDEINVLIIESTAVSLTTNLLNELSKKKIKVIFCDERHNPYGEIIPYYPHYKSSEEIKKQIDWSENTKAKLWQLIIIDKINKQAQTLEKYNKYDESKLLRQYINEVDEGDETNREGHAAKVYFNALFGKDFTRHAKNKDRINSLLDYGYSFLLSSFNKEINARGKLTQLGIWHDNLFNYFNLSSDLMEAFRPLVDQFVIDNELITEEKEENLSSDDKHVLLKILEEEVMVNGRMYILPNAIKIYVRNMINLLDSNDFNELPVITYG